MSYHQVELQSGESMRIGTYIVTLLDIENDEVIVQIEDTDDASEADPIATSDIRDCEPVLV